MKIGIAGAGSIIPEFLKAAQRIENFDVIAISGRVSSKDKLNQLAREYKIKKIYMDYDEMLHDTEIDAVYIAVPNHVHFEYAKKALLKHKHVILEKPFTSNHKQACELAELSMRENITIFEAITNQYYPNFIKMKEHLPDLGDVKIVQMNYTQYSKRYDQFKQGMILPVFDPDKSGGALMDLNVYNIHLVVGLFGEPIKVAYHANIEQNIDTSGILIMEYPTFQCVCIAAKDCEAPVSMSIQGDQGYLYSTSPTNVMHDVSYHGNDGRKAYYALNHIPDRFYYELEAFRQMIEQQDMLQTQEKLKQSLIVMKILDDARRQAGIRVLE